MNNSHIIYLLCKQKYFFSSTKHLSIIKRYKGQADKKKAGYLTTAYQNVRLLSFKTNV